MKKCIRCEEEKPIEQFYKHNAMADGHLNVCKDCVKKRASKRERELRKNEDWVESERKRGREKYHRLGYSEKKPDYESKKMIMKRYNEKYPEKQKARESSQRIRRPKGHNNHHWSYNKEHWKDIIQIKARDHMKAHRYMSYDQERMMYRSSIEFNGNPSGMLLDTREIHENFIKYVLEKYKDVI